MKRTAVVILLFSIVSPSALMRATRHDFSAVTALIEENLGGAYEGNAVILVETGSGERIYQYEGGAFTTGTLKEVASASKWFAGAVMLALEDRGWFDLDRPIAEYLPVYAATGTGTFTARQAFGMVGGFYSDADYEQSFVLSFEQTVNLLAGVEYAYAPGTAMAYDGTGMQIAGFAAQESVGTQWNTLARTVLLDPLGLEQSRWDFFVTQPGVPGGLRTTPNEYMRFLQMILNDGVDPVTGNRILSPHAIETFFLPQSDGLDIIYSPFTLWNLLLGGEVGRLDYTFGAWTLEREPGSGVVTALTSPGAFKTFPFVDRKRDICGIIFLRNTHGVPDAVPVNWAVIQAINAAVDQYGLNAGVRLERSAGHAGPTIHWSWNASLEHSEDLIQWRPLEGASSPMPLPLESATRSFYRAVPTEPE